MTLSDTATESWVLVGDSNYDNNCKTFVTVGLKLIRVISAADGSLVLPINEDLQGGYDRTEMDTTVLNMPLHL